jgi:hypothetical protein
VLKPMRVKHFAATRSQTSSTVGGAAPELATNEAH